MSRSALVLIAVSSLAASAVADPCGMVPPIYLGEGLPITRVGLQKTYVFHKDGVETFVIRPGFSGKVEDFGMLISFPEPPAIRKVPDDIFAHIEKAIDPPEVVVDLRPQPEMLFSGRSGAAPKSAPAPGAERPLAVNQVRVVREEAIGMYEVAVLEAGSAAALKQWMDDHGYKYPEGMDKVCEEYVADRWCFVAVKTKVGGKKEVDPMPGAREVKHGLPSGATFDGFVQAMGFRFRTDDIVVPMRLSAFNAGDLRNVVYLLTDGPRRIRSIPEEYVVRQLSGEDLYRNLTGPLPLRVIGGTVDEIPANRLESLARQRNPTPHNGLAKELFGADLLAISQSTLALPHETDEKALLRIGEAFGLRGPETDRLNHDALEQQRKEATAAALADLKQMTLTVVDGDFPRETLAKQNLTFAEYEMPPRRNSAALYDANTHSPASKREGERTLKDVTASGIPSSKAVPDAPRVPQIGPPARPGSGSAPPVRSAPPPRTSYSPFDQGRLWTAGLGLAIGLTMIGLTRWRRNHGR